MNKEVKFIGKIDDKDFNRTELFFEAPKEFLNLQNFTEATTLIIKIEFPLNEIKSIYADISFSPIVNNETIDYWGCWLPIEEIEDLINLSKKGEKETMNAFKNKVRCNNCEAVFYENFIIKEDEGSVCPVCGGIGYLMNIPEKEFPQYYFQVPVYPILSKCNDFNKMLKDLSNDDLQYIENVLQKYDKGQINMYTNKNGEHIFVED